MSNRRTMTLLLALLIGAVASFLVYMNVSSVETRAFEGAKLVRVFVVKNDIEKNASGDDVLSEGYVGADEIPQKYRPATALTDKEVLRGKVALTKLSAGQVLVDGMFVDPATAQVTAAKRIPLGQVAVTIQVDSVQGVAGLIVPGDKVNVIAAGDDGGQHLLYQNVNVLFIGNTAAPQPGSTEVVENPGSNLVTLAVPPLAAQKLIFASHPDRGDRKIHLVLVPPDNAAVVTPPANFNNLFTGGITPYES